MLKYVILELILITSMEKNVQEEIYKEYYPKVKNYLIKQVNNYHLAEDLCSDIFVKVYDKYPSYNASKSSLSTWIFTITRNHLIDYYRSNHATYEIPENFVSEEDTTICTEENLELLTEALKKLNDKERSVIINHYYLKMTLKEVAVKLRISYAYAKILHTKALFNLKETLKDI